VGGIGNSLADRRKRPGHRVQHAALAAQHDGGRPGRRLGVGAERRLSQRQRDVGVFLNSRHVREPLLLRAARQDGPEVRLEDLRRALHRLQGFARARRRLVEHGHRFERPRDVGVVRSEDLFANLQRAFVQRLGVGIATLFCVKQPQAVQRICDIGMVGTERVFFDG
jgi:hypothetical protein